MMDVEVYCQNESCPVDVVTINVDEVAFLSMPADTTPLACPVCKEGLCARDDDGEAA